MLQKSTVQLLRLPFSYFLMPLYWFALSFVPNINWCRAALIFGLLHLLLYPASNGYNSYMDRDEASIGGVEKPMPPTKQLFWVSMGMDVLGMALAFCISLPFFVAYSCYILCSRLYSYRGIRLKQYPIIGFATVIINQGALTFFMVYHGASSDLTTTMPWQPALAAAFLIGGFYPITQVYQHRQDADDGVTTISILLGIRGTFLFCGAMYGIVAGLLLSYFSSIHQLAVFALLLIFFTPIIVYVSKWLNMVWQDATKADFKHTMQLNWLASTCTNLAFITLLMMHQL
ncbi:UbiA family prenyltransferase [Parasediminibacterium paludis]|uniref:UbiA family prenyltransferase n=1 Tax=Parasediminibacterium paludis TaxID=908966 RepID=A0ABV8PTA2_9BACT